MFIMILRWPVTLYPPLVFDELSIAFNSSQSVNQNHKLTCSSFNVIAIYAVEFCCQHLLLPVSKIAVNDVVKVNPQYSRYNIYNVRTITLLWTFCCWYAVYLTIILHIRLWVYTIHSWGCIETATSVTHIGKLTNTISI